MLWGENKEAGCQNHVVSEHCRSSIFDKLLSSSGNYSQDFIDLFLGGENVNTCNE